MDETRRAAGGVAAFNTSRMEAVFPLGGTILYRSLDNPDNVRGYTASGIVIDEVADVAPAAWYEVLRPMLIDTGGWLWAIGTPKGRNWFWTEHIAAQDRDDSRTWQVPTLGVKYTESGLVRDPHPLENPDVPFDEIVQLYRTLPERVFRQEILGEFIQNDSGVFRRVLESATAPVQERREHNGQYLFGVDFARDQDFTVIAVWDVDRKQLCHLDRFNQIDYTVQLARLNGLSERFKPAAIVAEANSMGGPLVEFMRRSGLPVRPFTTTNATKAQVIEALALGFEQGAFQIIPDPVLIAELQAYELERLPSGLIRYGAPSGMHDDAVIAAALAYYAASAPPKRVRSREY